jgi:D-glycero-alpha-D-manno-heptose-7-phosphate kinase
MKINNNVIITKTPLRISFIGGGTDIPLFYEHNNYGSVISSTIDKYLYVIVKKQNSLFDEKYRLNYSVTETVKKINDIKNPIIRACLAYLKIKEPLFIGTISDIPASSGMGSSSTFCVGLLNALYKLLNKKRSQNQIAEEAANIEINILKRNNGKQDHFAASYGGINKYIFYSNKTLVKKINISKSNLAKLEKNSILLWTGQTRDASKILKDQNNKMNINNDKFIQLLDLLNVFEKILLKKTIDLNKIGDLLDKNWNLKKKFAQSISNKNIDKAYLVAMRNGAYGGKILGAGGGGFLYLIAPISKHQKINKSLKSFKFKKINFLFNNQGSKIIKF